MGKRWTDEEKQIAVEQVDQGQTYNEIGETLGRSEKAVRDFFFRIGKQAPKELHNEKVSRGKKYLFTDEEIQAIKKDYYKNEMTIDEICKKYHFSIQIMKRIKKEHKFRKRIPGKAARNRRKIILPFPELYRLYFVECLNINQIKKHFDVHYRTVIQSIEFHGMDLLDQEERISIRDEFEGTERRFREIKEEA